MNNKTFCKNAIENGYTGNSCEGWDWIKENLAKLDYVFNTEEYRKCNGMKYLCMPLIVRQEDLTDGEERILSTAWYLNNDRVSNKKRLAFRQKMLGDGWAILTETICQQSIDAGTKLELHGVASMDWLFSAITGKFKVKKCAGRVGPVYLLIPPKRRTKGYTLDTLTKSGHQDCFCKKA